MSEALSDPVPAPATAPVAAQETDDQQGSPGEKPESQEQQPFRKKRAAPKEDPKWFEVDDEHNTNVYVSNLPLDMTYEEFIEFMGKCGLIMKDPDTHEYKVKMYKDSEGNFKGDARCCYIRKESVTLALQILDEYNLNGKIVHVERAQFQLKGNYDPSLKPKKKRTKRDKEKLKKRMDKLFDWRPDKLPGERHRSEKTVVLKNMFDPKEFEEDPQLILEYRRDVSEECEQKCGSVKRVDIYDLNPEGVITVTFHEFDAADACVELMNGRYFAGRKLIAEHWDGKTKYKKEESEEEIAKRRELWEKFLESEHHSSEQPSSSDKTQPQSPTEKQNPEGLAPSTSSSPPSSSAPQNHLDVAEDES